jgi:hypothetical protein
MSRKEKIEQFLIKEKGYEPHYKGFSYLVHILFKYEPKDLKEICKIYKLVSKDLKVTSMSIERCLRTLFETSGKKTTNKKEIFALFYELREKNI